MNPFEPHWYAVYTRSRHEKSVAVKLEEKQMEVFLPLRTVLRRWKDRRKEIRVPLFTSYVFVHMALSERLRVLQTPGVVLILSEGSKPIPIPQDQIAAIEKLVSSGFKYDPYPYLKEGTQVNVVRGPLQGITGILIEKRKQHLLVLSVDLIQQSAALQVDISDTDVAGM